MSTYNVQIPVHFIVESDEELTEQQAKDAALVAVHQCATFTNQGLYSDDVTYVQVDGVQGDLKVEFDDERNEG